MLLLLHSRQRMVWRPIYCRCGQPYCAAIQCTAAVVVAMLTRTSDVGVVPPPHVMHTQRVAAVLEGLERSLLRPYTLPP